MKILQIHKYCSQKRGGGSVTAFFETVNLLKRKGHEVQVFSMKDQENQEEFPSENFAKHFDFYQKVGFWKKIKLAIRSIYNFEAQKSLEKFLKDFQPEVAHIHNIYHYLTPSIFFTLKKHRIPMVLKLSDYKLICPNYKLFNKGKICQKCQGRKYYHCFLNCCLKKSFAVSFLAMIEAYVHALLASYQKIDLFLAPSIFMKEKCQEFGISKNRIEILRNTINEKNFIFNKEKDFLEENYFLYYGRFSEEKGLEQLIETVWEIKKKQKLKGNKLVLVGNGPMEEFLKSKVIELNLQKEVKFWGFKKGEELQSIIRKSKFVVLPSIWFDNSPLVISEAQLLEKAVLISDLGGSKELIIKGKTGEIFSFDKKDDFIEKLIYMLELSQEKRQAMGKLGRKNILQLNNENDYYQKILAIYQKVIKNYQQ